MYGLELAKTSAMDIRVCALRLWVLLHVAASNLHQCSSQYLEGNGKPDVGMRVEGIATPEAVPSWVEPEEEFWRTLEAHSFSGRRRYFYAHNETQIAMARTDAEAQAEAQARNHDAGGATALASILGSPTFPDFASPDDGCLPDSMGTQDLSSHIQIWNVNGANIDTLIEQVQILAVDSCSLQPNVLVGNTVYELCSRRWVWENADSILSRDDPRHFTRSFKVLVQIRMMGMLEVLADGVYFPATGKMHLVGCARGQQILPDFSDYATSSTAPPIHDFELSRAEMMNGTYDDAPLHPPATAEVEGTQSASWYGPGWHDPDDFNKPPLNSSIFQDCAISATLQYPPLNSRWNSDRVLKYSLRSNRAKDDPLYFPPLEQSAFFAYAGRLSNLDMAIQSQRRYETGGRMLLLALGLVCVALQIEHGRQHEESLPFVSLVMLAIQLAHHLAQTSIFKDFQMCVHYTWNSFLDSMEGDAIVEWSEHVPYQAVAMAAMWMYGWMIHKVYDRRRIMRLRVLRNRPGAKHPPNDRRVMYATLACFAMVLFLGFVVMGADHDGHFRRELTEMRAPQDNSYRYGDSPVTEDSYLAVGAPPLLRSYRAVSNYEASGLVGVVVSLFLVPQLLGNWEWGVHGHRPLSAWFYAGVPFLQSLPRVCAIATHFQLLPIFPLYDPYISSLSGLLETPTPWWHIAVVLCSSLQVIAVHSQFSRSLIRGSTEYYSSPKGSRPHDAQIRLDIP